MAMVCTIEKGVSISQLGVYLKKIMLCVWWNMKGVIYLLSVKNQNKTLLRNLIVKWKHCAKICRTSTHQMIYHKYILPDSLRKRLWH